MAKKSNIEALLAKKAKLEEKLREQAAAIKDAQARESRAKAAAIMEAIRQAGLAEMDPQIVAEAIKLAANELANRRGGTGPTIS